MPEWFKKNPAVVFLILGFLAMIVSGGGPGSLKVTSSQIKLAAGFSALLFFTTSLISALITYKKRSSRYVLMFLAVILFMLLVVLTLHPGADV